MHGYTKTYPCDSWCEAKNGGIKTCEYTKNYPRGGRSVIVKEDNINTRGYTKTYPCVVRSVIEREENIKIYG